ncbi:MAG TPA: alpha/beta hydrolase [Opitutaceae bacterium]|nr:alpha/beta hydrolase [Opitutaceae bacterium]
MLHPRHLLLMLTATVASAQVPDVVRLWPGAAPGSAAVTFTEKITERSKDPKKHDRIYTQIVDPELAVHRPAHPNGVAVIIAPGGGYERIVIDKEGPDTSAWLNGLGVTAFVLKYRLPDEGHANGDRVPLQDAERAVRVVRAHAAAWGLDPHRIGFLGYSAGGHLSAMLAFHFDAAVYDAVDDADALSARPDFSVIGYPMTAPLPRQDAPSLVRMFQEFPLRVRAGVSYPPVFILQADDDHVVGPRGAAEIYLELKRADVPAELHIFRHGGHGFGIRDTRGPNRQWPELCAGWMKEIGILR